MTTTTATAAQFIPTDLEVGLRIKATIVAVATAAAFVYALGYAFGTWLHEFNDDVTALLNGNIFLTQLEYIRKLRGRGLSYRAIAKKLCVTEYRVRKAIGR